jgi:hypothetical protein
LENRRTDAGFPRASTGRRRSVASRSLDLSLHSQRNVNRWESDSGSTINPSTKSGQVQDSSHRVDAVSRSPDIVFIPYRSLRKPSS